MNLRSWLASGPYANAGAGYREEFRAVDETPYALIERAHTATRNELIVVTDEDGRVFTAEWTGCTCYAAWKDAEADDLTQARDFGELWEAIMTWNDTGEFQILNDEQLIQARAELEELKLFE